MNCQSKRVKFENRNTSFSIFCLIQKQIIELSDKHTSLSDIMIVLYVADYQHVFPSRRQAHLAKRQTHLVKRQKIKNNDIHFW